MLWRKAVYIYPKKIDLIPVLYEDYGHLINSYIKIIVGNKQNIITEVDVKSWLGGAAGAADLE